jgi:hypothetical protein
MVDAHANMVYAEAEGILSDHQDNGPDRAAKSFAGSEAPF